MITVKKATKEQCQENALKIKKAMENFKNKFSELKKKQNDGK